MRRHPFRSALARWAQALVIGVYAGIVVAQTPPAYVFSGPLLGMVLVMPENAWLQANANLYSNVWTSPSLEPLNGCCPQLPSKIIQPWSSFAWDSNRGDLILYGGGHANYPGNDVYRWHASTLQWERASLPSEIVLDPVAGFLAIDGVDNAPISSHTYDNNLFLPIVDRFLTWGGATYNNGFFYVRVSESNPSTTRPIGPYLFDPNRADGNKVGGTTGSNVKRVLPASIAGGQMWQNRDIFKNIPTQPLPGTHVNGCASATVEGGRDVVYTAASSLFGTSLSLWRYQLTSLATPALDQSSVVGAYAVGVSGQTTCGFDPLRKLFVRTGNNTTPFQFWDLTTPGPANFDKSVAGNASITALQNWMTANSINIQNCGLKHDPTRARFVLWCGADVVWELTPPPSNTTTGWTATQRPKPPPPAPPGQIDTGVLGKWRYMPYYNAFIGLQDATDGDIWIYKPVGWVAPRPAGDLLPTVTVTSPAAGTNVAPATPITLTASASDPDGTIARVEYYLNGNKVGQATTPPYSVSIAPILVGSYSVIAVAVDNLGGMAASAPRGFTVSATLTTNVLQRSSSYAGAADTYLDASAPSIARGASPTLYLDPATMRPLVRFAIFQSEGGPVPNGAVIQSATLALYKQSYDDPLQLNALLKPWVEAEATWTQAKAGVPWSLAGAAGAGTDYIATSDALVTPSFNPGWVNFDVTARARNWSSGIGTNNGWIVTQVGSNSNLKQFNASEYTANPTLRPKLTVVWSSGPAPTTNLTIAVWRPSTASFFIDVDFDHNADQTVNFGAPTDKPLVGRIDTSGAHDLVVYRNGLWYADRDRDGVADFAAGFGGIAGDVPLLADFNGDGRDDLVIYRGGQWFVSTAQNGVATMTFGFGGLPGDIPLAGDVNGDGIADLVIYRNGIWYIDTNRDGVANIVVGFGGMPGDRPLLFDFDGDGKADLCIVRNGVWYVNTKLDGTTQARWTYGLGTDIPLAWRE